MTAHAPVTSPARAPARVVPPPTSLSVAVGVAVRDDEAGHVGGLAVAVPDATRQNSTVA